MDTEEGAARLVHFEDALEEGGFERRDDPPCGCVRWMSAIMLALAGLLLFAFTAFQIGEQQLDALLGMGADKQYLCDRNTGGTCFVQPCAKWRAAVCVHEWTETPIPYANVTARFPTLWHSCACREGQCAGSDGRCYQQSGFPRTIATTFRVESLSFLLMVAVLVGRSGFQSMLLKCTGLQRGFGMQQQVSTNFEWGATCNELKTQFDLNDFQVVAIGSAKLVCWHLAQIVWYAMSYLAFSPSMGLPQKLLSAALLAKELLYFIMVVLGVLLSPNFLLFAPLSDDSPRKRIIYALSPDVFIAFCIDASVSDIRAVKTMSRLNGIVGAILSIAAWPAAAVSFTAAGVAFPSLLFAYALSGLSLVGVIASAGLYASRSSPTYGPVSVHSRTAFSPIAVLNAASSLVENAFFQTPMEPDDGLMFAAEEQRGDKEFVMQAVRRNGRALRFAAEALRRDQEVVMQAVQQNGIALEFATEELRCVKEVVMQAVQKNGRALEFAAEELRGDKEVVMQAAQHHGRALKLAAEELRRDREVVMQAVQQDGGALEFAAEELRRDKEVVMLAIQQDGGALRFASEELRRDKEVMEQQQNSEEKKVAPIIPRGPADRWKIPSNYEVRELIGSGSYGSVCEVYDNTHERLVAIKRFGDLFEDLIDCKRILREVAITAKLQHQSIVKIYEIVAPRNMKTFEELYLVMEICDSDLKKLLKVDITLTQLHISTILYNLLLGLKYLHSARVYHRDLKPANCLVNQDCTVKICDFGLARAVGLDFELEPWPDADPGPVVPADPGPVVPHTQRLKQHLTGHVVTRWYRAPELLLRQESYTEKIDVWSVGCIYAELLGMLDGTIIEDRGPLFPGKPEHRCPVKTDYKHYSLDTHAQLMHIFTLLGTPSDADIEQLERNDSKRYVRGFAPCEGDGFKTEFPLAGDDSIEILDKMLRFNPSSRITVDQALECRLFCEIREPASETIAGEPVALEFEEEPDLHEGLLRKYFCKEVRLYHPEIPQL